MGIFTTALRNKKIRQILKKKYLTSLPQRIACYLTAYFDEKSPFERVVHFEVFNVHKKSPYLYPMSLICATLGKWKYANDLQIYEMENQMQNRNL